MHTGLLYTNTGQVRYVSAVCLPQHTHFKRKFNMFCVIYNLVSLFVRYNWCKDHVSITVYHEILASENI